MTFKNKVTSLYYEIVSAIIITFSVVPGFNKIGNLFLQIVLTAAIVIIYLSVADRRKIKPQTVSNSLIIMCIYWIIVALYKQVKIHITIGNKNFLSWIHLFYYDKPSLLFVVFFAAFLFYSIIFIRNYNDNEFVKNYTIFQKKSFIAFFLYYIVILVYCFIIVRKGSSERIPINFIPFNIFKVMEAGAYEYEYIFLFFGNIAIFLPLGIMLSVFLKNKHKWILISAPFIVSIGIEISQYYLGSGWADIDDVILNVIGFFIGVFIKFILDKLIQKTSKGKIKSVFLV